mmetsp:Transcript_19144/g.41717  ORF Transcript_19144/g.41717 Transcript_19144/m.41717 type:complete len:147 (-) Transcript_19144:13-453(-)
MLALLLVALASAIHDDEERDDSISTSLIGGSAPSDSVLIQLPPLQVPAASIHTQLHVQRLRGSNDPMRMPISSETETSQSAAGMVDVPSVPMTPTDLASVDGDRSTSIIAEVRKKNGVESSEEKNPTTEAAVSRSRGSCQGGQQTK